MFSRWQNKQREKAAREAVVMVNGELRNRQREERISLQIAHKERVSTLPNGDEVRAVLKQNRAEMQMLHQRHKNEWERDAQAGAAMAYSARDAMVSWEIQGGASSSNPPYGNNVSEEETKQRMFQEAMGELEALAGMGSVKDEIQEALALASISKARDRHKLKNEQHALHMVFTGNPGTGKTTVARIVGKLFVGAGLLHKGNFAATQTDRERFRQSSMFFPNQLQSPTELVPFVECGNADISSAFWGEDEKNMKKKFDQANGGVLFVDEAYSMISRSGHRSGEKVASVMVQEMENRRGSVSVIVAGYPREMEEFIHYNPGFASRFAMVINFANYDTDTLLKMAENLASERDYLLTGEYLAGLARRLDKERELRTFGNARTVRNILEQSIRKQAKRVHEEFGVGASRDALIRLEESDLVSFNPVFKDEPIHDPFRELIEAGVRAGVILDQKLMRNPKLH
jgi:stage V sporulation protein K